MATVDTPTPLTYTAPNRATQDNPEFSGNATSFASQMLTFGNELLSINPQIASAASQTEANSETAAAFASATKWVTGQTITEGDARWSPIDHKTYRANTDITSGTNTVDPSASGNWTEQNSSVQVSAAEQSSAVNITLVSTSEKKQSITMTASGKSLTLPDATNLSKGIEFFIYATFTSFPFNILNDGGFGLGRITPGRAYSFKLLDNADADGTWLLTEEEIPSPVILLGNYTDSTALQQVQCIRLNATQWVRASRDSTNNVECTIIEADGTAGTPVLVTSNGGSWSSYGAGIVRFTDTTFCVAYWDSTNNEITVAHLTRTTGTTLVVDSTDFDSNLAAGFDGALGVGRITATRGILYYATNGGSFDNGYIAGFNISGTTVTVDSSQNQWATTTLDPQSYNLRMRGFQPLDTNYAVFTVKDGNAIEVRSVDTATPPALVGLAGGIAGNGSGLSNYDAELVGPDSAPTGILVASTTQGQNNLQIQGVSYEAGDAGSFVGTTSKTTLTIASVANCYIMKMSDSDFFIICTTSDTPNTRVIHVNWDGTDGKEPFIKESPEGFDQTTDLGVSVSTLAGASQALDNGRAIIASIDDWCEFEIGSII